ncbi:MAG TPA: DUF58 domain-containing protein [Polyangia bacterium]|nr:DUF58 domain-containing protein [Polyangia bacterium]
MAEAAPRKQDLFDEQFLKKLEYLAIVSRKVFAGRVRAERRSRKVGAGIEFADHRDYAPGDDIRYLDWNLYGRLEKLLLRLFEEEEDLHVYLLTDASGSMRTGHPPKLEHAMKLAAALAYVALSNLDRVSIVPFGGEEKRDPLPPARGKGRIFKVFNFLRELEASGRTHLYDAAAELVHRHKRRGLVVLTSDFYDPDGVEGALNVLRHHRFEPIAIHVYDPREARPELKGDLEIVDCETGEARPVTISSKVLAAFAREHERYLADIESFCASRAIPYFRAPTDLAFDELVLQIFRRGGFLR